MIELKESNPVELAEYTVANGIQAEPAFNWRANYFLRKREGIISKVNSRFKKSNIKFGIEIPSTFKETLELDRRNGNEYWEKAIKKEMNLVGVAFRFNEIGEKRVLGARKLHTISSLISNLTLHGKHVMLRADT